MWFKANFSFASPNECAVVPLLHIHCFRRGIYFPLRLTQGSLSTSLTPTLKVLRVLPALLHISYSCHRLCVSLRRYFRYFAVTHFLKQSLSLISALRLRILTECLAYFFYCVFGCCYFCVLSSVGVLSAGTSAVLSSVGVSSGVCSSLTTFAAFSTSAFVHLPYYLVLFR